MKKHVFLSALILAALALVLFACVQAPANPPPAVVTAAPGSVEIESIEVAPLEASFPIQEIGPITITAYIKFPAVYKDWIVTPPTPKPPTVTSAPPTVTSAPPTATSVPPTVTSAPPTATEPPASGVLPQFVNGGFEAGPAGAADGWVWYSDVHKDGLISDYIRFYDPIYAAMYRWRAYNSERAAWMGRIPYKTCPDCAKIEGINGIGERSLLAQRVTIPADSGPAFMQFQLLLRSVERACDVDNYPADMVRLFIGDSYDPNRPITTDDEWVGFLGVCRDHTTILYKPVTLPFDFSVYAGQAKWFKLLISNDLGGETHFLIDDVKFVPEVPAPAGLSAQGVQPAGPEWQAPEAYEGEPLNLEDWNP